MWHKNVYTALLHEFFCLYIYITLCTAFHDIPADDKNAQNYLYGLLA